MVEAESLSGDFVRTMKQLIDVLRQVMIVAGTQHGAGQAADQLFRGVVAAERGGTVEPETVESEVDSDAVTEASDDGARVNRGVLAVCPADLRVVSTDRDRDW